MIAQNKAEFENSNITLWQTDNQGEGTHIVILDDEYEVFLYAKPTTNIMKFDTVDENSETGHGAIISAVGYEIAKKAKVTYIPFRRMTKNKKREVLEWIRDNEKDIDVVTMSLTYTNIADNRELWDILKDLQIPFFVATGNAGDDKIDFPACLPQTIAVGAFDDYGDKIWRGSNRGVGLDILGYNNIYYMNSRGTPVGQIGTSISTPFVAFGTLLYISWRKRNGLPKLTRDAWKEWQKEYVRDIEAEGYDLDSGLGLFRLPNEIPEIKEVSNMVFNDTKTHWAKDEIDFISELGLMNGIGDNKFAPDKAMTRAEVAAVIARMNGFIKKK